MYSLNQLGKYIGRASIEKDALHSSAHPI